MVVPGWKVHPGSAPCSSEKPILHRAAGFNFARVADGVASLDEQSLMMTEEEQQVLHRRQMSAQAQESAEALLR